MNFLLKPWYIGTLCQSESESYNRGFVGLRPHARAHAHAPLDDAGSRLLVDEDGRALALGETDRRVDLEVWGV